MIVAPEFTEDLLTLATLVFSDLTVSFLTLALVGLTVAFSFALAPFLGSLTDFLLNLTLFTGCLTVTLILAVANLPSVIQRTSALPGPTAIILT